MRGLPPGSRTASERADHPGRDHRGSDPAASRCGGKACSGDQSAWTATMSDVERRNRQAMRHHKDALAIADEAKQRASIATVFTTSNHALMLALNTAGVPVAHKGNV